MMMPEETFYEIRISELLDKKWVAFFEPFKLTINNNETILSGEVHDQAELFGLLLKIRDLGLKLVSVTPAGRG